MPKSDKTLGKREKKDAIDKAIRKAKKKDLKRKQRPERQPIADFKEADVTRCLELLKDPESSNGYVGIARTLKGESILMTKKNVADIDKARAERLAEIEAESPVEPE